MSVGVKIGFQWRRVLGFLLVFFTLSLIVGIAWLGIGTPRALANPFATVAKDHFAYDTVKAFLGYGLGSTYVEDRVRVGESITYFDLSVWSGELLDRLRGPVVGEAATDSVMPPLGSLISKYNTDNAEQPIDERLARSLHDVLEHVAGHMEVLGYALPADFRTPSTRGETARGIGRVFEDFRLRGESRIRYVDVNGFGSHLENGDLGHGEGLEQSYKLQLGAPVSSGIAIGAELSGSGRLWSDQGEGFELDSGAIDIGVAQSAIARVGDVTGDGLSELTMAQSKSFSGVRAGVRLGELGSMLIVGKHSGPQEDGVGAEAGALLTAWDGSMRVSDRLKLGATWAHVENESDLDVHEDESTVIRLGGVYSISPQLTLSGEMAQSARGNDTGGAVKVGAILHPLPELTVGAFVLSAGSGYRPLFSEEEPASSRLDLSAEIGRWILSLRRSERSALDLSNVERDPERTTAVDLEVRFDEGKVSLGYVLENVKDRPGSSSSGSVRTASASVEHTVGPIGRASAGFSIVDQVEGSETSSNLGVRYDFDDTSLSLRYEIFTKIGDVHGNVTTAEVSIKF